MSQMIIYPNSDISIGIDNPSGSHYDKLLSQDDDGSTVYSHHYDDEWQYDVYGLPVNFGHGTINSVSVVFRVRTDHATYGRAKCGFLSNNGNYYWGSERNPTSWTTYTETWSTNPETGQAWTIADIAGLKLALGLHTQNNWNMYCTQLYILIDYTPYGSITEKIFEDGSCSTKSTTYVTFVNALNDISSGDIVHVNSIVVIFRGYGQDGTGSGAYGEAALYTNSSYAYGSENALRGDGVETTYAVTWETNPVTGQPWTKSEINALQAGVAIHTRSGGWTVYCTKVVVFVTYTVDQPPTTPSMPSGTNVGAPTVSYEFTSSATDPESDLIKYTFDWGDNNQSESSYLPSGDQVTLSHAWAAPGTYSVKVKATDSLGAASGWSSILTVVIASPGSYARVVGLC